MKNKDFIKQIFFIFIIGVLINVACFLLYKCDVKARSNSLPFYVDYYKSGYFSDSFSIDLTDTTFPNAVRNGSSIYWISEITGTSGQWIYANLYFIQDANLSSVDISLKNHDLNTTLNYSDFDFTTDYVVITGTQKISRWPIYRTTSNPTWKPENASIGSTNSVSLLGRAPGNINSYGYTPNVPFLLKDGKVVSLNDNIIFTNGTPIFTPVPTGHATEPNNDINTPQFSIGHNAPSSVPPNLTINNYTWTTVPTLDFSDVINAIESVVDLLSWIANNIYGEFNNLISNIVSLGNYIGSTIQYYGGLILDSFKSLQDFLYNNFVSLFESISDSINYIIEPVSGSVIYDNISSTSLVTNYNAINSSLTIFIGSFESLSEPNSFTIPIHLENLPTAYFGNLTTQYIDVGVIDPVKSLIRVFMWAILTYSLVITIFDSISNYINGGGDES